MLSVRPIFHCTGNTKHQKATAFTNCWVAHTLATLLFVLERLGFRIKCNAVLKASLSFSSEEHRQRFRIKRMAFRLALPYGGLLVSNFDKCRPEVAGDAIRFGGIVGRYGCPYKNLVILG